MNTADDLLKYIGKRKFSTILADPPWQFQNRTGKMAPEHKRLSRYSTMKLQEIKDLPIESIAEERAHLASADAASDAAGEEGQHTRPGARADPRCDFHPRTSC